MRLASKILAVFVLLLLSALAASAQSAKRQTKPAAPKFGPNVQAYLDYLKNELTVTDVPESQREVSPEYVRHNFNRVSALRQFAIKLAGETEVDYVPEMEAIAVREFPLLFRDEMPKPADLKIGEVYQSYRFLGSVRNRETFYIFARLDPFEEEAQRKKSPDSANAATPTIEKKDAAAAPETMRLTRERILYGAGDKPKNAQKQPN